MQFFNPVSGSKLPSLLKRFANSTVMWSWILNGLRIGSGLIVLPLVFHTFSSSELGMYQLLLKLAGFSVMIDFGFGPTIDRFLSYAMGGAEKLEAHGVPETGQNRGPNFNLLWQLLVTTRRLYRRLTVLLFAVLGIGGTLMIEHLIRTEHALHPEFSLAMARFAWATTLLSTLLDIYSNWWGIYLRGMNEVRTATKIAASAAIAKFIIAVALLLAGAGLLALPLATIVSSIIQRHFARVRCLQLLPPQPELKHFETGQILRVLWPNSWRLGVQIFSSYALGLASSLICANIYHLEGSAVYDTSVQLMGYASGMASVWTLIKWPLIGQYQARRDYLMIQRIFWPRIWLQMGTFLILGGAVVWVGPAVLHWIGRGKQLLPVTWLSCLMVAAFMDLLVSTCGSLIASGNRLPFLWPGVATNCLSLILSIGLLRFTSLGIAALVLGPLLAGFAFNYWFWPPYAIHGIKNSFFKFLFLGPALREG